MSTRKPDSHETQVLEQVTTENRKGIDQPSKQAEKAE